MNRIKIKEEWGSLRVYTLIIFSLIFFPTLIYSKVYIGAFYYEGWGGNNKNVTLVKNAPIGLSDKMISQYGDREPIWGWRDDNVKTMEKQISLASKNGIDFFAFDWYWQKPRGPIDTAMINNRPENQCIKRFKAAKNRKKMRFALLVANHGGSEIVGESNWRTAVDFWSKNYFSDPQYLKVDNKPVIEIFDAKAAQPFLSAIRDEVKKFGYKDIILVSNGTVSQDYDYTSWYNITNTSNGVKTIRNFKTCIDYVEQGWNWWGKTYRVQPVVMAGWDNRPWQITENGIYYINRSPELFYNQLVDAVKFVQEKNYPHKFIFIYAWNELGEGGYLVPTKGDPKGKYLKQIKKLKRNYSKILAQ